jgi:hypothetical protein
MPKSRKRVKKVIHHSESSRKRERLKNKKKRERELDEMLLLRYGRMFDTLKNN